MGDEAASPFQPRARQPLLHRTFPVTKHLPGYPRRSLRRDLVAGGAVAALAIPSAMAYAAIAGLEPIHGLYALLLPAIGYMVFGSSRQLIVGPEGSLAVLVATAVSPVVGDDPDQLATAAAMLAVLVAAAFCLPRLLRLGWVADYISRAVLVGYIPGVAVGLIVGQLGKIFGLSIAADDPVPQLERLPHGRQRPDGRPHTGRRQHRCVGRRRRAAVPHDPRGAAAVGVPRCGHRRRGRRARRAQAMAGARPGGSVSGGHRGGRRRRYHRVRRPPRARGRRAALDRRVVTRSARPHDAVLGWVPRLGRYGDVSVHPSARTTPGVVVYRLDDRLIFADARYVKARLAEAIAGGHEPDPSPGL